MGKFFITRNVQRVQVIEPGLARTRLFVVRTVVVVAVLQPDRDIYDLLASMLHRAINYRRPPGEALPHVVRHQAVEDERIRGPALWINTW